MTSKDILETFLSELESLIDETFVSIDSALLSDEFTTSADQSLDVIPNNVSDNTQVE